MYLLSIIASAKNIHIISSIDHINSSILWDQITLHNFNWMYYDCTTYLPYDKELTSNITIISKEQSLKESGIVYILQSLTPNHRELLQFLAEYQLNSKKTKGIIYIDLYQHCRDEMIVNSDRALKNMLHELQDHELLSHSSSHDGKEYIYLTVSQQMLEKLANNFFDKQ